MSPLGSAAHLHYNIRKVKQLDFRTERFLCIYKVKSTLIFAFPCSQMHGHKQANAQICSYILGRLEVTYNAIQAVEFISMC